LILKSKSIKEYANYIIDFKFTETIDYPLLTVATQRGEEYFGIATKS